MKSPESMSRDELEAQYHKLRVKIGKKNRKLNEAGSRERAAAGKARDLERALREASSKVYALEETLIAHGFRFVKGVGWSHSTHPSISFAPYVPRTPDIVRMGVEDRR